MTENAAIDHSEALREARSENAQMPNAQQSHPGDLHVPKNGTTNDNSHADRLNEARGSNNNLPNDNIKNALNTIKNVAETASPSGLSSLFKQINIIADMPYIAAIGAAILKDLIDLVAAETVILSILFSILCSIFIFMMMLLTGSGGKRKGASKIIKKILFLISGGIADSIPGIDFLPIETVTVIVIYVLTLMERRTSNS